MFSRPVEGPSSLHLCVNKPFHTISDYGRRAIQGTTESLLSKTNTQFYRSHLRDHLRASRRNVDCLRPWALHCLREMSACNLSSINIRHRRGPSTEPWDTSRFTSLSFEKWPPSVTLNVHPTGYFEMDHHFFSSSRSIYSDPGWNTLGGGLSRQYLQLMQKLFVADCMGLALLCKCTHLNRVGVSEGSS